MQSFSSVSQSVSRNCKEKWKGVKAETWDSYKLKDIYIKIRDLSDVPVWFLILCQNYIETYS